MNRGVIAWIDLNDTHPSEMGKMRPAIIVSNAHYNERLPTVVIVPLSSRAPEIWPLRVKLSGVARKDSFAVVPGIRQISKARVQTRIGEAPSAFMRKLDEAIESYLSD